MRIHETRNMRNVLTSKAQDVEKAHQDLSEKQSIVERSHKELMEKRNKNHRNQSFLQPLRFPNTF